MRIEERETEICEVAGLCELFAETHLSVNQFLLVCKKISGEISLLSLFYPPQTSPLMFHLFAFFHWKHFKNKFLLSIGKS